MPVSPADSLQWPDKSRVAQHESRHAAHDHEHEFTVSVSATLTPASGPVNSQTTLRATGLPPNTEVGLFFVTARGNRMTPSGWNLDNVPLATATTKSDGSLTATLKIPDDLGGWHMVKLSAARPRAGGSAVTMSSRV